MLPLTGNLAKLYTDRYNYFNTLSFGEGNEYLDIYHASVAVYNGDKTAVPLLAKIKDTPGLANSWGYAKAIIEQVEDPTVAQALVGSLLEVLPAYVDWVPTARVPENQIIVNFLNQRASSYRKMNNPKFYAYDRAITHIAECDFRVTTVNAKYIAGVGESIAKHVVTALSAVAGQRPTNTNTL